MLAAAQAVEHYEITRYGTLRTWAKELGLKDAVALLEQTLAEESETDELLTGLAETAVNAAAQKPDTNGTGSEASGANFMRQLYAEEALV